MKADGRPTPSAAEPSQPGPRGAAEPWPAPRALIVDDNAENRDILLRRFTRRGYDAVGVDSGFAALSLVAEGNFDIVLLDVMMPGLDGIATLREIRRFFSAGALPVIMVTAKNQSEDVVQALSAGANDYITKPVDFAVALARANTQVARKRAEQNAERAHDALREANRTLENRIAQRTADLTEANAQLKEEIAQRQESDERAHFLAYHDALTRLGNRIRFMEELKQVIADADRHHHQVVILYVDLDGFKAINDTHGHLSGDQVLQRFADRLRAAVPTHNRLARLGGDEFAIIQVLTEEGASPTEVAAEVTAALNAPVMIDHAVVGVGASVGVAVFPIDGTGPDQLLQRADMAMYRAKSEGRGQYRMFEADMAEAVIERRTLELELRGALGRDEFEVYYQPIVQLETGQVTAFEALLRWHHPTRGLLPGADFVNVAEDVGLIVEIGRWVLAQACRAAVEWPIDIKIAVNVSAVQFLAGDVLDAVTAALAESGLSAKRLELEITESALLDGSEANLETLTELRALGVSIAMDDFGTGHSSLAYLRRFPFDKIKIDQGFVRDMSSENSRAIVRAVASLGASLGIGTTAEGVETLLQLSYLREEGYKEVQGYYLGMPRPAAETLDFLADLERNIA